MKSLFYALSLILLFNFATYARAAQEEEMIQAGKRVKFNYVLKIDGKEVENSEAKGPIEYTQGEKRIIPGLEKQLEGLRVGDQRTIMIKAEDGFGKINPNSLQEVPKSKLPQDVNLKVGQVLGARDDKGEIFPVTIAEVKDQTVVLDFNHPLAGKDLQFDVTVLEIK